MIEKSEKYKPPIEGAVEKIMTAQEYAELGRHVTPYIYEVRNDNKIISYFGVEHINNPENPQFEQIEKGFNDFKPNLVLVEGRHLLQDYKENQLVRNEFKESNQEELVRKYGEVGMAMKLAMENNIEMISPEPKLNEEVEYIKGQGFSQDEMFAYYVLRLVPLYQRQKNQQEFSKYIEPTIDELKNATDWENFDYSLGNVERVNQKLFNSKINFENPDFYNDKFDPIPWKGKEDQRTVFNEISENSMNFRDREIIKNIVENLNNHDKIFIVYGASHAVMQEAALRELIEN